MAEKRNPYKHGVPGSILWHVRQLPHVFRTVSSGAHVDLTTLGRMSSNWRHEQWHRESIR